MKRSLLLVCAGAAISAVMAAEPAATPAVKFSGDMQYRLRYHFVRANDAATGLTRTGDYTNVYLWNFRMTATPVENLTFNLRLSNPSGAACDKITTNTAWAIDPQPATYNAGNAYTGLGYNILAIPELYFKWTYSMLSLSAGFIPVSGSSVLDLMAFEYKSYDFYNARTGLVAPFDVTFNNSQRGIDVGYMVFKDEQTSAAADLVVALATDAPASLALQQLKRDQWRFILTAPISLMKNMVTVKPAFTLRDNVYRSADLLKFNTSYIGGIDIGCKPVDALTCKIGGAFGGFNNDALESQPGWDTTKSAPRGVLAVFGLTANPGFGTVMVDYNYCTSRNMLRLNNTASVTHQSFVDLKYAIPVKKLAFIPRLRVWYQTQNAKDAFHLTIRPELIMKAGF